MNASKSCMTMPLIALLWVVAMTVPGAGEAAEARNRPPKAKKQKEHER